MEEAEPPNIVINVENIPITNQTRIKPPPPRPTVPVPSEDESIPEDATIEETTLKYANIFEDEGPPGMPSTRFIPPKPIAWVFPEYPEEEKKKGVHGVVKLSIHIDEKGKVIEVVVLDNTTNSEKCAQAAVDAAYGSRFRPARDGARTVNFWITQPYRFDIKK
ncbi:MAG: energy transducer TonB [bacterium]